MHKCYELWRSVFNKWNKYLSVVSKRRIYIEVSQLGVATGLSGKPYVPWFMQMLGSDALTYG